MVPHSTTTAMRYVAAVALVGTALLVRWLLDPMLGDRQPYTLVIVAVAITARLFGLGPSLIALVVGCLASLWLFVEPRGTFAVPLFGDWFALSSGVAGGGLVAWLIDQLVGQRDRLIESAAMLESKERILRKLIDVQENERQVLCHDLHDGMMQYAVGAKMLLESSRESVDRDTVPRLVEAAIDDLDRGIAEGRRVIRGVRSAVLDDLGLTAAIHDLADQLGPAGITVGMTVDAGIDTLAADLQNTIYRLVQESLSNVRKHAAIDRATVTVRRTAGEVHVQVADRGRGFEVREGQKRGFGLVGMSERVRLAGGVCDIRSRPGEGTRIDARLPIGALPPPEDAPDASSGH